jgi:hypothetical protein
MAPGGAPAGYSMRGERLLDDLLGLMEVAGHQEQLAQHPADHAGIELLEARAAAYRLRLRIGCA